MHWMECILVGYYLLYPVRTEQGAGSPGLYLLPKICPDTRIQSPYIVTPGPSRE